MTDAQLIEHATTGVAISSAAKNQLHARINDLPIGLCTRIDKSTLARPPANKILKVELILPRTIIIENHATHGLVMYILLNSKVANSFATGAKGEELKILGSKKIKVDVLRIYLTKPISLDSIKLMALLKKQKYSQNFACIGTTQQSIALKLAQKMRDEFGLQAQLAQACNSIMDLHLLALDNTFELDSVYAIAELGIDLLDEINLKNKPNLIYDAIIVTVAIDIANALSFLHKKGYVYRDIKPENILIDKRKNVFLTDFGIVCKIGEATDVCWTNEYSPRLLIRPELYKYSIYLPPDFLFSVAQIKVIISNIKLGHPGQDIWSFGILLLTLLLKHDLLEDKDIFKTAQGYINYTDPIRRAIHSILFPPPEQHYLLASLEELQQDQKLPLLQQRYLSMEKINYMLTGNQVTIERTTPKFEAVTGDLELNTIFCPCTIL